MADFTYTITKVRRATGLFDWATGDFRVILLELATDENPDDDDIAAVLARAGTTELTSTGYAREALVGEAVIRDDPNNQVEFNSDDPVFAAVSQLAAETVVAAIVYEHIGADSANFPVFFFDSMTGLPLTPNGSDITITVDSEGWAKD